MISVKSKESERETFGSEDEGSDRIDELVDFLHPLIRRSDPSASEPSLRSESEKEKEWKDEDERRDDKRRRVFARAGRTRDRKESVGGSSGLQHLFPPPLLWRKVDDEIGSDRNKRAFKLAAACDGLKSILFQSSREAGNYVQRVLYISCTVDSKRYDDFKPDQ